ncbi:MAG TPA: YceI family protein [Rubricoccaceae bacterium]|nr:YceI family protein [Rubricoccaceae bacterium]
MTLPSLLLLAALIAAPAAPPVTLAIDPARSEIAYTGSSPLHDWTGRSRRASGTVTFDPAAPARGARIRVEAPVASFDSGSRARDREMRRATEAARFPTVAFQATAVQVQRWGAVAGGQGGRWTLSGTLTFHGQTRPLRVEADVRYGGGVLTATGSFPVQLSAFGVERPRIVGLPIRDEITLRFEIVAAPR